MQPAERLQVFEYQPTCVKWDRGTLPSIAISERGGVLGRDRSYSRAKPQSVPAGSGVWGSVSWDWRGLGSGVQARGLGLTGTEDLSP